MIHINLMTKVSTPETIERLQNAKSGAFKLIIFHLKNENKLQEKLIGAYSAYCNFMECRLNKFI